MYKRLVYVLALSVVLAVALVLINSKLPATGAQIRGLRQLDFDRSTGYLTVHAEEASLTAILRQLRDKHRIEVMVPNLAERLVTANIVKTPLPDALRQLLPEGSRFHFTIGETEVTLPGKSGAKKTGRVEPKPRNLPTKDKTGPTKRSGPAKLPPEKVKPVETRGERGTKFSPQDSRPVQGVKEPRKLPPERERHVRLNLIIKRPTTIEVVRFMEVEGRLIPVTTISGDFVYAAFVGGQIAFVGSIQDPLGIRSYLKDYGHSIEQAESGTFVISLPERFLNRAALSQTVIKFFYLSESAPRTLPLTPQTFSKMREYLKPAGEVGPRQLVAAFGQRYGRRTAK